MQFPWQLRTSRKAPNQQCHTAARLRPGHDEVPQQREEPCVDAAEKEQAQDRPHPRFERRNQSQ